MKTFHIQSFCEEIISHHHCENGDKISPFLDRRIITKWKMNKIKETSFPIDENEELKDSLRRRDNDLKNSEDLIGGLQNEVRDLSNKMGNLENERKKTQEKLDEVLPEVQKLQDKLAEAKKMLDDEVLKKADLENHCQRLDEELKFKIQLLEQQLTEVKTRKEVEITEMDSKLQEEYEDRLQKALNELREVYNNQMTQNRDDFAKLYETRVKN